MAEDEERQEQPVPDSERERQGESGVRNGEAEGTGIDEALQEELTRLQDELSRFRELYLRKLADFENFRRRKEKEMQEFRLAAHGELLRDVLPILDNLERALAVPEGDGSGIHTGVGLVLRQLKDTLARYGLVELDPLAMPFDPRYHEAVAREEREDLAQETVVEVLQKGYLYNERLLRPALVVVGVPSQSGNDVVILDEGDGETGGSNPWVSS